MLFEIEDINHLPEEVMNFRRSLPYEARISCKLGMATDIYKGYLEFVGGRPTELGEAVRNGEEVPRIWGWEIFEDVNLNENECRLVKSNE